MRGGTFFFFGRGIYLITPACTRECSADEMKEEETGGEFIKDGVGWGGGRGGWMRLYQMLWGEGEDSAVWGE